MLGRKQTFSIDRETTRFYLRFTRPYLKQNIALLILRPTFLFSAFIGNIVLVSLTLDKLAKGLHNLQLWRDFGGIIIAALVLEAVRLITGQLMLRILWKVQIDTSNDIAAYVYENIIYRDATFHANHFTGSLVSQTNKFIDVYERLHDIFFWELYALIANMVATFAILFVKLPSFAALLLLLVIAYTAYSYYTNKKANALNGVRSAAENANTGQLADSVTNILTVKSYAHEEHEIKRYALGLDHIVKANDKLRDYTLKKDFRLSAVVSFSTLLALVMSIFAATHGYASIGTIALATSLTRDTIMRLREFNSSSLRNIARAYGDAIEMTKILLTPTNITDPSVPLELDVSDGQIEFKNITFWYPEETATQSLFNNLNLKINASQKVGLVGPSGGGKTTVTRLLLRFLDIQDGLITIDGQDISKVRQTDLRQAISYVPQEPLLFHRSISENIRYGKQRATDEEVISAAKKANAHDFVIKLPNGYDTLVGERGVKLSGGQRQRIAIARAMLKNAPILVLDEATSALDSEAEVLIQDALSKLMQGKTTLVIAHRLSTIQRMDRIVVLQDGKIEEDGTHSQLLKNKKGLYSKLWAHQSGGFLKD